MEDRFLDWLERNEEFLNEKFNEYVELGLKEDNEDNRMEYFAELYEEV